MKLTTALPVIALVAATILPGRVLSQAPPDAALQVDHIFEPWSSVTSPGCAVGVAQNGLTVFARAWGMADLEHDIPNTPATIFEGGSLAKQFTAAAVMMLTLEGKLSLTDDVRKYLPEVPDYGRTITLRHLLTHTSGLRDWGSVASISGWGREERTHDHAHVLDIVSRQSALNFDPGHEYSYSNTGYNLLAMIVARVSGKPFAEFSRERIFEPLGLENTQWRDDYTRIVKGRSTAYAAREGGIWAINHPIEDVHGNGGLLSTVGDLLIWNEALSSGRLGGPEFVRLMHDQGMLNDGRQISYAAGLQVGTFDGVPSVTHTGSTAGYRGFLGRYPDQKLSVAMLCNASNVNTGGMGGRIARAFLGDAARTAAEPPRGVDVPTSELDAKVGLYRDVQTWDPMRVTMEAGRLEAEGDELIPLSPTEFQVGASDERYTFLPGAGGARPKIRVTSGAPETGAYEPVEEFAPTATILARYVGEFHSRDAETSLVLAVEEGRLVAHRRPDRRFPLSPVYPDVFTAPSLGLIRFIQDGSGRITELSIRQDRVYDMRFQRGGG